jgi:uncharacterized protein YigE (DUF2233 family)
MNSRRSFTATLASCAALVLGCTVLLIFLMLFNASRLECETGPWRELEDGLLIGEFESLKEHRSSNAKILVLKIDPRKYSFKLLSASENEGKKMTLREWSEKHGLIAAFNAGMYQEDGITSVGYMKNFKHINNGRLNKNKAVLAFGAIDADIPEIQIIDRECQNFENLKGKYRTFVQSIRMVSCDQQNVWSPQATAWSTLAIGMDKSNKVLVFFSQQPYAVHDLIEILLSLPLSLYNAMYLEGGPQASLYLSAKNITLEKCGNWEASPGSHSAFQVSWPIPNVIGIVRK